MLFYLTTPLSSEEFDALQEVGEGQMQRIIPTEHRDRLLSLGFIVQRLGGLVLTNAGHMRLAGGR
jgi:hypothetical protein